jgi:hypothetical protein
MYGVTDLITAGVIVLIEQFWMFVSMLASNETSSFLHLHLMDVSVFISLCFCFSNYL